MIKFIIYIIYLKEEGILRGGDLHLGTYYLKLLLSIYTNIILYIDEILLLLINILNILI